MAARGPLMALALANARFWPTVAPHASRELRAWHPSALQIPDPELRKLALTKQRDEHFNAQVAATLATLAPRPARRAVTEAIVALELLFDYLDGRTERPSSQALADGARLSAPFVHCLDPGPPDAAALAPAEEPDAHYLNALAERTRERSLTLPARGEVADAAGAAARRCAEAQVRLHAAATLGDPQLQQWAEEHARHAGLGWREYAAGSASSVLAMHALIAAAADPATTADDARRLDRAYLPIAAVITLLDSLVDAASDLQAGRPGIIRLYATRQELAHAMQTLIREALARASRSPARRPSRDDARRSRRLLDQRPRGRRRPARSSACCGASSRPRSGPPCA